jgi:hypothetical protein
MLSYHPQITMDSSHNELDPNSMAVPHSIQEITSI